MAAKPILIVTPFFAPQSHAAVFRAHKLAKYLPDYGWTPHVLTVDTNYLFNEDPGLLAELPAEVSIHRARHIEPTLRGIRMALGGHDRTFPALHYSDRPVTGTHGANHPLAARVYRHILQRWIQSPDEHWTWIRPAVELGRRIIQDNGIRVIFTTGMPYSCNQVGIILRGDGGHWVADLRDPMGYGAKSLSRFPAVVARQQAIVRRTLQLADEVTATSDAYCLIMKDVFPEAPRSVRYIPTGIDEALLPGPDDAPPRPWPYLIFTGEFQDDYDDFFFETLALTLRRPDVAALRYRVLVAGHAGLNSRRLGPRLEKFGLREFVEFVPHQPQRGLYRLIQGATGALLIPGRTAHWWNHFAKLCDYLALRKPVVAVVPDPSDARSSLTRSGLGVFLDGSPERAADTLAAFFRDPSAVKVVDDEICEQHTARRQVEAFVEIFERLNRD